MVKRFRDHLTKAQTPIGPTSSSPWRLCGESLVSSEAFGARPTKRVSPLVRVAHSRRQGRQVGGGENAMFSYSIPTSLRSLRLCGGPFFSDSPLMPLSPVSLSRNSQHGVTAVAAKEDKQRQRMDVLGRKEIHHGWEGKAKNPDPFLVLFIRTIRFSGLFFLQPCRDATVPWNRENN